MTIRYTLLTLFLLLAPLAFSQESSSSRGSIEGIVANAENKEPIELATIKILNKADSTLIQGASASHTGGFKFSFTLGEYILEASMLGYEKQYRNIKFPKNSPVIKLDTIFLNPDGIYLQEMQIVAELPAMQVKGDTIEFNAGAYNVDGSTVLKDLIKQIPGLELDESGTLKANGKVITKILVDGKEYFGSNINKALSTLPAEMINKLQLFEKESEEAKASGIKDADPEQVLNLDVKKEFKTSTFGDLKSGVGNKGRHVNLVNLNKMHGDNQYAIVGNINNINDYGGSYGGYGLGSNFDDNIDKEIGANFNIQESEKLTFNGSATYRNNKSKNESTSESYSSMLNQYTSRENKSISRRQDFSIDGNMEWRPDSMTTIFLRTNLSYNEGNNESFAMDTARFDVGNTTYTSTSNFTNSDGFRTNNSLMLSRKLNNKGRNITLSLFQNYNTDDSNGINYSEKTYLEEALSDIIDQKSEYKNKSSSFGVSARYVEPLGKDNRLYFSYSINTNNSERLGDVRIPDAMTGEYTEIDSLYSRNFESRSLRQNIRIGFQQVKEKYNFNIGFSVDPSSTRNKSFLVDSLLENLKQDVINFSPSARISWTPHQDTHLDFSYYGSTSHPYITQLSSDTIRHSASSKTVGNPKLKPSFNNNFNLSFRKSDIESGRYFAASINYSYTFNSTVGYQIVDKHSNVLNQYRNIDGNSNAYAYITYNTPLKNKKINIGTTINTSYSKNIDFLNEQKRVIERVSLAPSLFARVNFEKIESNINLGLNHTIAYNPLADKQKSNNTDYRLTHFLKIKLPLDFSIESNFKFSYRAGLGADVKKDEMMWNLAASKLFLKDKRGSLKFEFFDVLNDLRQQEYTVNGSDYNNYWRKVVNNYFIVSFSYRFNVAGKKS